MLDICSIAMGYNRNGKAASAGRGSAVLTPESLQPCDCHEAVKREPVAIVQSGGRIEEQMHFPNDPTGSLNKSMSAFACFEKLGSGKIGTAAGPHDYKSWWLRTKLPVRLPTVPLDQCGPPETPLFIGRRAPVEGYHCHGIISDWHNPQGKFETAKPCSGSGS